MKALIVDDEPMARRRLVRMLGTLGDIEVVGEAGDGLEALGKIRKLQPDIVFLDIRMPGLDGLSLALQTRDLPPIVFTTAYTEHALQAFDAEAVDYLLKPIELTRLNEAVNRVRRRGAGDVARRLESLVSTMKDGLQPSRVAARSGSTIRFFDPLSIGRFTAENKFVAFEFEGSKHLLDETILELDERLSGWGFVRPHRSELVNLRHVIALHVEGSLGTLELANGDRVPVSRRRLASIRTVLGSGD